MSMDINWNVQAISALDVSAMAASENIANANTENYRPVRVEMEDGLGGKGVRVGDIVELTSNVSGADTGLPRAGSAEFESGSHRPGSISGEGSGVDIAREMVDLIQVDRAYSANIAAIGSMDNMTGNILDMMA